MRSFALGDESALLISLEHWSEVTINAKIPDEKFAWLPPAGWQQWEEPIPVLARRRETLP